MIIMSFDQRVFGEQQDKLFMYINICVTVKMLRTGVFLHEMGYATPYFYAALKTRIRLWDKIPLTPLPRPMRFYVI